MKHSGKNSRRHDTQPQLTLFDDQSNENKVSESSDKTLVGNNPTSCSSTPIHLPHATKFTGIPWIGNVPLHWKASRTKYYLQFINGRAYAQTELLYDGKYRVLRVGNFNTTEAWYYSNLELSEKQYCIAGDLLYLWATTFGPEIWHGEKVIFHYHIWKVLCNQLVDKQYIYYALLAQARWQQTQSHGSTMVHVTKMGMENSYIPVPPLSEQRQIAARLDELTETIDESVKLIDEQISDLREYRKSVITEVVTHGVPGTHDTNEMTDTGIEWIGNIPQEWQVQRLKYCVRSLDSRRIPVDRNLRIPGPYPYWGAGNIVDYVADYLFDEPVVLLGEDGAPFFDALADVAYFVSERIWVNNHMHVLKPLCHIDYEYLTYALNCVDYHRHISGAIIPKLTQEAFREITIPVPSLNEQKNVVTYLNQVMELLTTALASLSSEREDLLAYRQSLISEYVTGQRVI